MLGLCVDNMAVVAVAFIWLEIVPDLLLNSVVIYDQTTSRTLRRDVRQLGA